MQNITFVHGWYINAYVIFQLFNNLNNQIPKRGCQVTVLIVGPYI